jgi:hypothetical protein
MGTRGSKRGNMFQKKIAGTVSSTGSYWQPKSNIFFEMVVISQI